MGAKVGGRVIVEGPGMLAGGVAGLVTFVHEDGAIDAITFPRGSTTGLCVNAIKNVVAGEPWSYRPADPEPVALETTLAGFVNALKPLVEAAVEEYASGKETERQ